MDKVKAPSFKLQNTQDIEQYLSKSKELLEDAGITCAKWFRGCILSSKSFTRPVLIHNAYENDASAARDERKRVRETPEYQSASSDPVKQKQLMDEGLKKALARRDVAGKSERAVARAIGHEEIGGKFTYRSKGRESRFAMGTNCLLCGLAGHDIPQCRHFLGAYKRKHGKAYDSQAFDDVK
jgi:hypothetical protein